MTVLAFRPRPNLEGLHPPDSEGTAVKGTFRSPRGRTGTMSGRLRLQRLVIIPRGAFITGVFTGELREADGTLIGVGSRRATVPADLERAESGLRPVVRPLQLDLMGITIDVPPFVIEPALAFPRAENRTGRRARRALPAGDARARPL